MKREPATVPAPIGSIRRTVDAVVHTIAFHQVDLVEGRDKIRRLFAVVSSTEDGADGSQAWRLAFRYQCPYQGPRAWQWVDTAPYPSYRALDHDHRGLTLSPPMRSTHSIDPELIANLDRHSAGAGLLACPCRTCSPSSARP